jgi:hypothetical protein
MKKIGLAQFRSRATSAIDDVVGCECDAEASRCDWPLYRLLR